MATFAFEATLLLPFKIGKKQQKTYFLDRFFRLLLAVPTADYAAPIYETLCSATIMHIFWVGTLTIFVFAAHPYLDSARKSFRLVLR